MWNSSEEGDRMESGFHKFKLSHPIFKAGNFTCAPD